MGAVAGVLTPGGCARSDVCTRDQVCVCIRGILVTVGVLIAMGKFQSQSNILGTVRVKASRIGVRISL